MGDLVATDLEGTLTTGATWRGTGHWLESTGRKWAYRRFLLPRLPSVLLARRGVIDRQAFRERWVHDLTRFLAGLDGPALDEYARWIVDNELWPQRREAVLAELADRARAGCRIVIASGTYQPVADAFAQRVGALALGTPLEMRDGRATGRLGGQVGTRDSKAHAVRLAAGADRIVGAYGDTEADIPMLELADGPVAVHPDRELRRVALERGWRIIDG